MTQDEIYKLIEANGLTLHGDIEHFAALVTSAEREACAKVCDELKITGLMLDAYSCNDARYKGAEAIRARGQA